jgi:hypothetical protein
MVYTDPWGEYSWDEYKRDVKQGFDTAAEFAKGVTGDTAEGAANLVTLGGYGGLKQGLQDGSAYDSPLRGLKAYGLGVANGATFGLYNNLEQEWSEEGVTGSNTFDAFSKTAYDLTPMEEGRVLIQEWDQTSGWDKAEAIANGTAKGAMLLLGAKATGEWGAGKLTRSPSKGVVPTENGVMPLEEPLRSAPKTIVNPEPQINRPPNAPGGGTQIGPKCYGDTGSSVSVKSVNVETGEVTLSDGTIVKGDALPREQQTNPLKESANSADFTADLNQTTATSRSGHSYAGNKQLNEAMKENPALRAQIEAKYGPDALDRTSTSGGGRRNPRGAEWDHNSSKPSALDLKSKESHLEKTVQEGQAGGGWKKFHRNKPGELK